MPIYEYRAKDDTKSCEYCIDVFEEVHPFGQNIEKCPKCGNIVEKLVSLCNGYSKKQANQYAEVRNAKYWRDQNGIRHKVTEADGHAKSTTVSKRQTVSKEVAEARRDRDLKASRRRRQLYGGL
jgi:hypothetical protein